MKTEVKGVKELQAKLEKIARQVGGDAGPLMVGMRDSVLRLQGSAKKNLVAWQSPSVGGVDTGLLRASITPEIKAMGDTVEGVVGTNIAYAPNVEEDQPAHWPPMDSIAGWARRHGANAFLVARAISRRGTKGKHYMLRALQANATAIIARIGRAVLEIIR